MMQTMNRRMASLASRTLAASFAGLLVTSSLGVAPGRAASRSSTSAVTTTRPRPSYGQLKDAPASKQLTVLLAAPQGKLKAGATSSELRWMFDRPVVDLSAIADRSDPSKFVTIEPPMIGTFRWASTRMLVFTPDSGLAGSTKFSATLHDLTAVDGTGLAAPFVTAFETPTVVCRLVRTSPTWNRGASPATVAIDCDQPVDWNDVAAHASVRFRANKLVTKLYTPTAPDLVAMRNADPSGSQRLEADLARLADDKRALGATQIRFNHDAPCQSDSVKVCHWFVVGSMVPADATAVLDFQPGIVSQSGPLPSVAQRRRSPDGRNAARRPTIVYSPL